MIKKSKKILFTVLLLVIGILLIVFEAGLAIRMKTEKPEEILRAYFSACLLYTSKIPDALGCRNPGTGRQKDQDFRYGAFSYKNRN